MNIALLNLKHSEIYNCFLEKFVQVLEEHQQNGLLD